MKLILSSCDFRNDNARKTIIDNLSKPISQCKLLYIPNEKATFETIHSDRYYLRMEEFGFLRNNVCVFDYYNSDEFLNLDIDVLYISGGNTFATLDRLRNCNFESEIIRYIKNGVIYIGGSAGAHIASQNIEHVSAFDPVPEGMTEFSGLGLFDGILICHYTEERKDLYDRLKADGKYKIYALTNDDSLVVCSGNDDMVEHYDLLIDEDNDPVHDPEPLQNYMNKWDGPEFIEQMQLNSSKSVLEIGVGTGRLAVRVAPLCGEFYGVDISSKTIERAKENLAELDNVRLTCADFLSYEFGRAFDIVYSSLTFMHIEDKQTAINKVAALLKDGGKFVLSVDKNKDGFIDTGTRKITVFPDISLTESPKADRNFILWTLIPYIAAWSGEKLMDERIAFEEVATIRPDGAHNIYHASVVPDEMVLPDDYVYMRNWCGPMWNGNGEHILWQIDSEWSERGDGYRLKYSEESKRILSLYEREFEDRLSKDEYAWLAERGCVKTNGDYDGHFKSAWQIVVLASKEIQNKLLAIGERIKVKYQTEFDALKAPYAEAVLESVPAHLRKVKAYELQFVFHADGWFLVHCITTLLKNGKLKEPTEGQRKSLTTLITNV